MASMSLNGSRALSSQIDLLHGVQGIRALTNGIVNRFLLGLSPLNSLLTGKVRSILDGLTTLLLLLTESKSKQHYKQTSLNHHLG